MAKKITAIRSDELNSLKDAINGQDVNWNEITLEDDGVVKKSLSGKLKETSKIVFITNHGNEVKSVAVCSREKNESLNRIAKQRISEGDMDCFLIDL